MALDPASRARFNLERASILLLDETQVGMSILVQIVTGLGAKQLYRCSTIEQAQEAVVSYELDLAIIDSLSPPARATSSSSGCATTPRNRTATRRSW